MYQSQKILSLIYSIYWSLDTFKPLLDFFMWEPGQDSERDGAMSKINQFLTTFTTHSFLLGFTFIRVWPTVF